MKFYTNFFSRGKNIYVRGFDLGLRFEEVIEYEPYVFLEKKGGSYKTIDNKSVEKLQFQNMREAREFIDNNKEIVNRKIYGLTNFSYVYIYENYGGEIDYDPKLINIGSLDIECAADEGFPDISRADKPITAITLRCRNRNYVFGCGEFTSTDPKTFYIQCKDESELLKQFLNCWKVLDLDIVTGWNIEFFDIPYIVNRIKSVLGEDKIKKLSPWGYIREKTVEFRGKENQSYSIEGISVLDYYQLYRKFSFGNQESYKLDFIANIELGENKIDYSEYGNLLELYKKNFQKFIEYNIHDTVLVDRLDDKLKFIEQIMALAYDAKINFNDTMTTVRPWDVIIHNYLMDQGIVVPPMENHTMDKELMGGHVKDPIPALYNWVVSFDLNSLYPHLIMQYNISPEMFVGRAVKPPSVDQLLDKVEFRDQNIYSYAANGCSFRRENQGFLPALMEKMYNDRTKYKKLMLEAKQRYEHSKSLEDEKLIARYHNMQMAKKIQLNSAYGALGNQYFRWFNFDLAEAITSSGQLSVRWIERKINLYMNKVLKTDNVDYVIASDTDSIYMNMNSLVTSAFGDSRNDELKIVEVIDKFCEQKVQPYIDKCYQELADYMNAYQQKMQMKRETIANKGIWRKKKMYILNAWNVEGVQYEKPKIKIQGIEAVRSDKPHVVRQGLKTCFEIIMNKTEKDLQNFVREFHDEFVTLPFNEIAFPRGVNGMTGYKTTSKSILFGTMNDGYKSGTPIHVKGALTFNKMLKQLDIKTIPPISDGDKIKFAYLKMPNPTKETVIAVPDELPEELKYIDKYVDRELQFQKTFLEPLHSITNIIGWKTEKKLSLGDF